MSRCDGRPSEAIKRIELVGPVDRSRVYRAMRKPLAFPARFARTVVEATGGECTLEELIDTDVIARSFVWTNPDLKRRGLEYQLIRAANRRAKYVAASVVLHDRIAAVDAEIRACEAEIAALSGDDDDADTPPRAAAG
jgi:hypothetical protein